MENYAVSWIHLWNYIRIFYHFRASASFRQSLIRYIVIVEAWSVPQTLSCAQKQLPALTLLLSSVLNHRQLGCYKHTFSLLCTSKINTPLYLHSASVSAVVIFPYCSDSRLVQTYGGDLAESLLSAEPAGLRKPTTAPSVWVPLWMCWKISSSNQFFG